MTKEDLLKAMALIIDANESTKASQLIWDLWQNHGSYSVIKNKILHKETGKELGEK